jgi:two-component system, LytTR family, sensor kinase
MKPRWDRIALLLALWAFVGSVLALEVYLTVRVLQPEVLFVDMALLQFQRASLWVILVPLVLWLRVKMPLRSGSWVLGISFHLLLSFLLMAGYFFARVAYLGIIGEIKDDSFWHFLLQNFFGRNIIDMLYYWLVLGAGYAFEFRQRYRQEELRAAVLQSKLIQAELQVLKRQLHPHFLFNTMNTIAVLVREARNQEAVHLLAKLSSLLRLSLDHDRSAEVQLRQELDFIRLYVEIQQARFPDRLEYQAHIEPEAHQARVPNLILQPLVENAILHGVAVKEGKGLRDGRLPRAQWSALTQRV